MFRPFANIGPHVYRHKRNLGLAEAEAHARHTFPVLYGSLSES